MANFSRLMNDQKMRILALNDRREFLEGGRNAVGVRTIRGRLSKAGLMASRPAEKPFLTKMRKA